jgi:ABC-type dipeptide/oligopeptide/nickel transport system permease component
VVAYVVRRILWAGVLVVAMTLIGMDVGLVFGSAVFVEEVFGLAGLGSLALGASAGLVGFDLPVIAGVILVVSIFVVVINLVVDLSIGVVDPRVRVL